MSTVQTGYIQVAISNSPRVHYNNNNNKVLYMELVQLLQRAAASPCQPLFRCWQGEAAFSVIQAIMYMNEINASIGLSTHMDVVEQR